MRLLRRLSRHSADVVIGVLLAVVSSGLWELPAILLAIKLNVFAIPLALTGVLVFPMWVWYCIAIMWASQFIYYTGTDIPAAIDWIRTALTSVPIGATSSEPIAEETHEPE